MFPEETKYIYIAWIGCLLLLGAAIGVSTMLFLSWVKQQVLG